MNDGRPASLPPQHRKLLDPRSVAIVGASDNPHKVGGRPIHFMAKHGFAGRIYPVNPKRVAVQGLPCFASVDDLPEVPDAAIVAVEGALAATAVDDCARRGIPNVIVITAGFSELGAEGLQAQRRMVEIANARGTRVMGPNSLGLANFATGAILSFSTMYTEVAPADGPIALVGQSGASCVMPYAFLREMGLGARYLIGTGNDADLCVAEMVRMVADDAEIRLILCYLESIRRPELLAEAAEVARRRGASIVLLKGGASARGAVAAATHTGAIAGSDAAFDAFLKRHGIWRVHDMHELVNGAPAYLTGYGPGAGRTIVMSHSGGLGVMCADIADRLKLPLAELAEPTRIELDRQLPSFATATNPLDLTAAMLGNKTMMADALEAVGRDPQADMYLLGIPVAGPGYDVPELATTAAAFAARERKPFVVSAPQAYVREAFRERTMAVYRNETDALGALRQLWAHARLNEAAAAIRERIAARRPAPAALAAGAAGAASAAAAAAPAAGVLDEADSLQWLQRQGVPVVAHRVCADADAAARAFDELAGSDGATVVVKGCSPEVTHKSEHGLVRLGLADRDAVRAAAADCLERLAAIGCKTRRVIVSVQVRGLHELMLGVQVDPALGAVVMIGDGGKLVEIRSDLVTLLAPVDERTVREALAQLRIAPLFGGYRGDPPIDAAAIAKAAVALGDAADRYRDTLGSIDINPIIVTADGAVVAVDAVIEFKR
ncbi:MAG: acetate--CoA ligase family protein [Lautropia sp.]